jgi:hypothetical protein
LLYKSCSTQKTPEPKNTEEVGQKKQLRTIWEIVFSRVKFYANILLFPRKPIFLMSKNTIFCHYTRTKLIIIRIINYSLIQILHHHKIIHFMSVTYSQAIQR